MTDPQLFSNFGELLPLVYLVVTLPKHKCVKIILLLMILVSSFVSIVSTYQFVKFWSKDYVFQYGPLYLATLFMVSSEIMWFTTYVIYQPHLELFKTEFYWSLQMTDHKTQRHISKECTMLQRIAFLIIIFAAVLTFIFLGYWLNDSGHYNAFSAFVNEQFPEFSLVFHGIVALDTILWGFIITTISWFSGYVMLQLKFQLLMLCTYVKNMSRGYEKKSLKILLNDIKYQRGITEKLKFCINRHQEILSHHRYLKEIDESLHINSILITTGFMMGYFSILTLFSPYFPPVMSILTFTAYAFTMILVSTVAQDFEDASEYLANTIYDSNWFTWNNENLKTFKIFHLNTATKIWQVPAISFIRINNSFLKSTSQAMYSMANLLYTSTK